MLYSACAVVTVAFDLVIYLHDISFFFKDLLIDY